MGVKFTQFLMPDGRQKQIEIDGLDPLVEAKATWLINAGYRFEIEMLALPRPGPIGDFAKKLAGDGPMPNVSMEIMNPPGYEEDALCGRLAVNGPEIPVKVTEMIDEGHALVFAAKEGSCEADGSDGHQSESDSAVEETTEGSHQGCDGAGGLDQGSGSVPADTCD